MSKTPKKFPVPTQCPYCGHEVVLTSNKELYGKSYGKWDKCYLCRNCKASVGTHPNTNIPLGIMANAELKRLKMKAHSMFDPYWQSGRYSRSKCYKTLADKLGIPVQECHFGWFDKEMLLKAIAILERKVVNAKDYQRIRQSNK